MIGILSSWTISQWMCTIVYGIGSLMLFNVPFVIWRSLQPGFGENAIYYRRLFIIGLVGLVLCILSAIVFYHLYKL